MSAEAGAQAPQTLPNRKTAVEFLHRYPSCAGKDTTFRRSATMVLAALCLCLDGCAGGQNREPPKSPQPTISLRGGVRGEIGEAQKSERKRRESEQEFSNDPMATPVP